ncbi:MAG: hypothetical protein WCJ35_00300 [Planctomycetota bacterium]
MLELLARLHWHVCKRYEKPGFHTILRALRREPLLSPEAWQELQMSRLRAILQLAGENVPYYRRLFHEAGFNPESARLPDGFHKLPILTKRELTEHRNDLFNTAVSENRRFKNASGGSTGKPVVFWQDRDYERIATACDSYVCGWWGIVPGTRQASVWGADRDFGELTWRARFYNWRARSRGLNAFRMTESGMLQFCKMLESWKPPYLIGYASALYHFAKFAESSGFRHLRFRAIRSSAEMLYPEYRSVIEQVFQSRVFNFYGSREINNLAAECSENGCLHLISSWRYVEITDEAGNPVSDGVPGYITVTDCGNQAMPFIRYRNEDVGTMCHVPCSCGRPMPILKSLLGRSSDLIRTRSGKLIHGEFFTHLFYGRDDIESFQVQQRSKDKLIVQYVPKDESAHLFAHGLRETIMREMEGNVCIEFVPCLSIPVPPSGKHRFTISEVN